MFSFTKLIGKGGHDEKGDYQNEKKGVKKAKSNS